MIRSLLPCCAGMGWESMQSEHQQISKFEIVMCSTVIGIAHD